MASSQRCFHCIAGSSASSSASKLTGLRAPRGTFQLSAQRGFSASAQIRQAASGGASAEPDEGEKKIQQLLTEKFNPGTLKVADTSGECSLGASDSKPALAECLYADRRSSLK